jgi:hypothetical protein
VTDSDTTQQEPDVSGGAPWGQPTGWKYSWLGGFDPGVPLQPLVPGPVIGPAPGYAGWAEALAARDARPRQPVAPSPLHAHDAGCWGDDSEAIRDTLEGVGWVCKVTARYPTAFGQDDAGRRIVVRYDPWVWYPMDVVERTRG